MPTSLQDIVNLQKGGDSNPDSVHIVQGGTVVELPNKLFFAQFADGGGCPFEH